MTEPNLPCPDQTYLKKFLLGQLPVAEIEDCQHHLSQCDPCVETIENLSIGDTFTELAIDAIQNDPSDATGQDEALIEKTIQQAEAWSVDDVGPVPTADLSLDKAAEVQRLVREPVEAGDIGAVDHYRLLRLIGAGSTGIVYLAIDTKLDRHVVLKVLRPSLGELARQRFIAEAKATAAIDHPNVVTIYDVGNDGPLSYIAMQWIPGRTLEQLLSEHETLSVETTRQLVEQIANGLTAAHQRKLIHRDIKPANIWIPENDEPAKILDFGLVRVNDEDPQLTCTGMIAGTPCYMSPEQSRGDQLDERSDLFSLGCLMYQALSGKLPFRSDNALATLRSIQHDQPLELARIDPTIDQATSDLVMCLLAKSPARRPATAQALIQALHADPQAWEFDVVETQFAETIPKRRTVSTLWKLIAAMLIGVGLAALGFAYGQQIVRLVMNEGEIQIETLVDDVKIEIIGDGEHVSIIDLATERSIEIKAGNYQIRELGTENSITVDKNRLTLSRGETEIVKITRTKIQNPVAKTPREVMVFPLRDANANQVFLTLKSLGFGDEKSGTKLVVNEHQNQLIVSSDLETFKKIRVLVEQMEMANSKTKKAEPAGKLVETKPIDPTKPYHVKPGDILGVFIDGVLGSFDESPPIHIPDARTGLPPTLGFPIRIEADGYVYLPLVDRVKAEGKTLSGIRQAITDAFKTGENPILRQQARILVNLIHRGRSATHSYPLDSGDVLGVFIDGVLGQFDQKPPVHPRPNTNDFPSLGFPIAVEADGRIVLPMIEPIVARGKTLAEVRRAIETAYKDTGSSKRGTKKIQEGFELPPSEGIPILTKDARILVSLVRRRRHTALSDTKNSYEPKTEVVNPNGIAAKIASLERQKIDWSQRLGPKHPGIQSLTQQINMLKEFKSRNSNFNPAGESPPQSDSHAVSFENAYKRFQELSSTERKMEAAAEFIEFIERQLDAMRQAVKSGETINRELREKLWVERRNTISWRRSWRRLQGVSVSTIPVFDGKNYNQLIEVLKSERDLSKLNPAIIGLANLAREPHERDETIQTIMQIARRGPGVASQEGYQAFYTNVQQFFGTLPVDRLIEVFEDEMSNGNRGSRQHFLQSSKFGSTIQSKLDLRKTSPLVTASAKQAIDRIIKSLAENAKTDRELQIAFEFLRKTFGHLWDSHLELNSNETARRLIERIAKSLSQQSNNYWIGQLLFLDPQNATANKSAQEIVAKINSMLIERSVSESAFGNAIQNDLKPISENAADLRNSMDNLIQRSEVPKLILKEGKFSVVARGDARIFKLSKNAVSSIDQQTLGKVRKVVNRFRVSNKDRKMVAVGTPDELAQVEKIVGELNEKPQENSSVDQDPR